MKNTLEERLNELLTKWAFGRGDTKRIYINDGFSDELTNFIEAEIEIAKETRWVIVKNQGEPYGD